MSGASRLGELVVAVLLALSVVGCGGGNDDIGVDVLFLADRAEILPDTVTELYQQRAQEAFGTEVRVVETGPLYPVVGKVLEQIRGESTLSDLSEEVRDAEIIVVQTWPKGTVDNTYFSKCWRGNPLYEAPDPAVYDTAEYWGSYQSVLGEVYAEISRLRQGAPTVLIGIDIYDAFVASQQLTGITEECRAFFERWSASQRQVAEAHGAVFVSLYDTLNGPGHDLDPVQQGYVGPSEQMPVVKPTSPNEIGAEMIVAALAAVGFEAEA